MMKPLYLLLLLLVSGSAFADQAAIQKCRSLSDASARLACYDAIDVRAPSAAAAVAPAAAQAGAVAPAVAAAPAPAPNAAREFGLEAKKPKAQEENSVESTIAGTFSGWTPGTQITLANGQVWRVIDGSEAFFGPLSNPKAKVERNYFGTLFLKVEGTNHSAKVRRVK